MLNVIAALRAISMSLVKTLIPLSGLLDIIWAAGKELKVSAIFFASGLRSEYGYTLILLLEISNVNCKSIINYFI